MRLFIHTSQVIIFDVFLSQLFFVYVLVYTNLYVFKIVLSKKIKIQNKGPLYNDGPPTEKTFPHVHGAHAHEEHQNTVKWCFFR